MAKSLFFQLIGSSSDAGGFGTDVSWAYRSTLSSDSSRMVVRRHAGFGASEVSLVGNDWEGVFSVAVEFCDSIMRHSWLNICCQFAGGVD